MKFILYISEYLVPIIIFYIAGFAFLSKRPVFDDFIEGAKQGMKTVAEILPTLIGLMTAVGVLRASGFLGETGFPFSHSGTDCTRYFSAPGIQLGGNRSFAGYIQNLRPGFLCRDDGVNTGKLYGNCILYYECLLYDGKGNEDKMDVCRSDAGHRGRGCGKHNPGVCRMKDRKRMEKCHFL